MFLCCLSPMHKSAECWYMNYGQPVVEWMQILEKQLLTFTNENLYIKRVEKNQCSMLHNHKISVLRSTNKMDPFYYILIWIIISHDFVIVPFVIRTQYYFI
jgi:hypothetical protein